MSQLFKRLPAALCVGLSSFLGGIYYSEKKNSSIFGDGDFNVSKVVFAAAPFKGGDSKDEGVVPIGKDTVDSNYMWGSKESSVSRIMRFGFPNINTIRSFDDFVLSYDQRTRVPHWVFEHLTHQSVKFNNNVDRSKCEFFEDQSVHPFFRSSNKDYKGSGYDRGHLAAAGNHRIHQTHCEQTFVLSNIAPQVGKGFNRDKWNDLEKHIRSLTKTYNNVYVCSGPLYLPKKDTNGKKYVKYEVIGANNVAVPTHFFKVVIAEHVQSATYDLECYIMPNEQIDDKVPIFSFQVPLEAVEKSAGILLFERLPKAAIRLVNGRKSTFV